MSDDPKNFGNATVSNPVRPEVPEAEPLEEQLKKAPWYPHPETRTCDVCQIQLQAFDIEVDLADDLCGIHLCGTCFDTGRHRAEEVQRAIRRRMKAEKTP